MKKNSNLTRKMIRNIGRSLAFILALTVMVCSFAMNAFAAESSKAVLAVSQEEVKPNDEFVLTIASDGTEQKLFAYTARLSYDKNVFETVSVNSFEEKENWSDITYNADNQKFVLINKSGELNSGEMLQITMRVKDDAAPGKTKITLQGITASDGKDVIEIADGTVEVLVIREGLPDDGSVPVDNSFIDDFKDSVVTVKQSAPWLIAVFAVLSALAVAFFIWFLAQSKRRGYTAKKRNTVAIITGIIVIILLVLLLCVIFIKPGGDVNGDGQVDYNDTQEIVDYLLDIKPSDDGKADPDADLNNDGKVDIGDVGASVDKVKPSVTIKDDKDKEDNSKPSQTPGKPAQKPTGTKPGEEEKPESEPEVSVEHSAVPYLANKGETVSIKLNISARPKMDAKYIEIKGELYKLRKTGEDTYEADVPMPDKAGIYEINITGVVLENGKRAEANFVVAVDVLKDKPTVSAFKLDSDKNTPEISFRIDDSDNALKSGYFVVTDSVGAQILKEKVSANKEQNFKVRMEDGKAYRLECILSYDLDHDYFADAAQDQNVVDEKVFERDITFTRDFDFIASEFALTDKVSSKDDLVLTFKNGYNSFYKVSTVVVDGKEYPVSGPDKNGVYSVVIPKAATKGTNTVKVESVTLENDTAKQYPVNKSLNYLYLKDAPVINKIEAAVTGNVLHVDVKATDPDKAIKNITVYLKNQAGEIVKSVSLGKKVSADIPLEDFEKYTVEVKVAYDLGDGATKSVTKAYNGVIKQEIGIESFNAAAPAFINRGENVEVVFTVQDDTDAIPTHVLINGAKLPLKQQADGTYTVSFKAPKARPADGIAKYEVIRLYYGSEEVDVNYSFACEVLKLAPTVANDIVYDLDTPVLHFDVVDEEDAFISGRVIITKADDNTEFTFDFTNESSATVEIELKELIRSAEYTLQIELTYDLDNDKGDNVNLHTDIVKESPLEILEDYGFSISNYGLMDITNDTVTLEFTSTNASKYSVKTVVINGKEYSVQNNNNVYTVKVPAEDFGKERAELVFERVVLENLKAFTDELAELEAVLVFKNYPTAVITGATVSSDKTSVTAYFDITDNDGTITDSYVALIQDNEIIARAQISENGPVELKPETGKMLKAGNYTIEVLASFDAVDGLSHTDENITGQPRTVTVAKQIAVTDIKAETVYPQKGADVELTLTIDSNTAEKFTAIEISGSKYPAEKIRDNTYKVIVKASENAGLEEYLVSKAYFADEETPVVSSAGVTVDVLKDAPVINNGLVDTNSTTPILRFDLIDTDNAFISGQIAVESTGRDTLYFDFEKTEDSATVEIVLNGVSQNVIYTVKANVTYALDSVDDAANRYTKTIAESKFEWISDYEFTISQFRLEAMDEEWITLKFTSHNDSNYGVNKVVINGIEYYVDSRAGNEYTVKMPVSDITDKARTELKLDKVTLENLKAFEDELASLNKVLVFKTRPQANITGAAVSDAQDQISIQYEITDPDSTVTNLYAVVKDGDEIYAKAPIGKEENEAVITTGNGGVFKAGSYTVEIVADYNRADGVSHIEESITEHSYPVSVMKQVEIISVETEKYYYEKGEAVALTVKINTNVAEPVQYIKFSGEEDNRYAAEELGNGTYKLTVTAPDVAGETEYAVDRIDFSDEMVAITDSACATIDVLKTKPTIDTHTVKIDDTTTPPTLSFEITDTDNAFKSGKVIVKEGNAVVKEYGFDSITPQIKLAELKDFVVYTLDIQVTYDLDDNEADNANVHTEYLEQDNEFEILGDYAFELTELQLIGMDTESIKLGFTSMNKSRYKVQFVVINEKTYPATNIAGDSYTVEIPVEDTNRAKTELKLTEATLGNLKSFAVENANTVVFLDAPEVTEISNSINENTITIEVEPIDSDETITALYVTLLSVKDKTAIEQIAVKADGKYTAAFTVENADVYDVIISADYNRVDGMTHAKEQLYKAYNIAGIPITATVAELTAPGYVAQNGDLVLTFKVDANTDLEITDIKINGEAVQELAKLGEGEYTATVVAPASFGNADYRLTELTFENGETIAINNCPKAVTYVLKQAPSVGKYEFNDSLDIPEITIRIDDPDKTLLNDTITVIISDSNGKEIRRETIQANEEGVIKSEGLLHQQKEKYVLTIDGLYDLDDVKNSKADPETNTYNVRDVLGEREIELLDYEVHFESITVNSVNAEEHTVTITFTAFNNTEQNISDVQVEGAFYSVQGPDANGNYTATVPYTPNNDGKVEVTLEGVKLINGRIVSEPEDYKSFSIFLDKPTAEISSVAVAENMISITAEFSVSDADSVITTLYAVLRNADGDEVARKVISADDTEITLNVTGSGTYTIDITADYDRFDGAEHTDETLATSDKVVIDTVDVLELKNITKVSLYHGLEAVDVLDITNGIPTDEALQDYYVKIEMDHLPAIYASVKEFKPTDGKLMVIPDDEVFLHYLEAQDLVDELAFEISYKDNDGEHLLIGSAKKFFEDISKNLTGTYNLTQDLDASDIVAGDTPIINGTFSGTINGNGYKIINLPATMFATLSNATIDNLVIENANVVVNQSKRGIVATAANGSTMLNNVHVINSKIIKYQNLIEIVGGIVGQASNKTRIRNCSAVNVTVRTDTQAGGIAGGIYDSAIIEDCYATGTIEATFNNPTWGARAGGIVAWDNSTGGYIDHCYANVKIVVPNPIYSGGLVGGSNNLSSITVKNSFAINTGSARKVIGFDLPDDCKIENIWETNIGNAISSVNGTNRIRVADDIYAESFYLNTLGFYPYITWNLDLLKINKLPNLILDPLPNDCESYEILENANGIPNYNEVRRNAYYRADRELAYYNVSKLAPFTTVNEWVNIANELSNTKLLNEKITMVLAFDDTGELIVGLQAEDVERLSSIKVFYENAQPDSFNVKYLRIMDGLVAEYDIKDLGFKYQFDSYIAKLNSALVEKLVGWAEGFDYRNDIASTTPEDESRLYVDYYNESVQSSVEDIVTKYLLTYTDYPVYVENADIQKQIESSITEDTVKRLLYAYNYYDKWYNINLENVSLSDLLFFKGTVFGKDVTTKYLINTLYNATQANRDTNGTYNYYNYALQDKTGKTFIEFLEYTFRVLDGYTNYNDWFIDHFDGIVVEQPSLSDNANEIDYRIWDLMSKSVLGDRRRNILPILTAPQDDMYLISIPSQIVIGSLLRYNEWIKGGADRVAVMTERIKNFGIQLGHLYGTMANLIPDSPEILNKHLHFQYDSRFDFPQSEQVTAGTQDKGTTQDPVVKWVFEAINQLAAANGSGAYANGTDVWWVAYCALGGGDFTYFVFAHETAHNQDGYYFYDGKGRRVGTGPESHSDDNYGMAVGDNSIMFNVFKEYDFTEDISNNFSYKRIDSPDEIQDFYADIFEAKYAIDYMMAEAFLRLSPEEQARVAVKVSHTPAGNTFSTTYSRISADEIKAMKLKSVKDLMDNKLALHTTGTVNSASAGAYGEDSFYNVYWYQPFNNEGAPDAYVFRRNGREMLGIAGYMKGYVEYMSGNKTDLDALRIATGDPDITWEEYKMARFNSVKARLSSIPYFDYTEMIDQLEAALRTDAKTDNLNESTNVQKVIYGLAKRATNDFTDGDFFEAPKQITLINNAQELIKAMNDNPFGNYELTQDIDFSGIAPEGESYYVSNTFVGILNGAGHTISGLRYPLCKSVAYAQFKDITLSAMSYSFSADAYFAKTAKRSTINGIRVIQAEMMLPYFASKNVCYEYGENSIDIAEHEISTVEQFVAIGSTPDNLKKRYILTADVDFSKYTATSTSVITGTFGGYLNGNGHAISGLNNASLFANFQGTVENLIIRNFTNERNGSLTAAFAAESSNATFRNMYFDGIRLLGWQNTAPLSGYDKSSVIEQITVVNTEVKSTGYYAALLVARKSGGSISDCYVEGKLNINSTQLGGVVGELMDRAIIENTVANVEITRRSNDDNRNMSGGFVGSLFNNATVRNSIALGNMIGTANGSIAWKFTSSDANMINSKVSNSYELKEATGNTSIRDGVTTLKEVTNETVHTVAFWRDTLQLSDTLWSFDNVEADGHPMLKHNGLNTRSAAEKISAFAADEESENLEIVMLDSAAMEESPIIRAMRDLKIFRLKLKSN